MSFSIFNIITHIIVFHTLESFLIVTISLMLYSLEVFVGNVMQ